MLQNYDKLEKLVHPISRTLFITFKIKQKKISFFF